ncbi:MAG: hypothetical protein U0L92_07300 [Clostridia bacterium]|nr:hypothetical protein [Clostridia bacterium]
MTLVFSQDIPFASIWNGEDLDIRSYLTEGKSRIRLTLVNNLHNLLGPHHLEGGESHNASPSSFYKEPCVWKSTDETECLAEMWNDGYTFVETSLEV